jgi:hypothetical protein
MKKDYSRVYPGLYQGSIPVADDIWNEGFSMVILAAQEHQPEWLLALLPKDVKVIYVPLDDSLMSQLQPEEAVAACEVGRAVGRHIRKGGKVLVTCAMGLNRSGLISAFALYELTGWPAASLVHAIRQARGFCALSNPQFVRLIYDWCPGK